MTLLSRLLLRSQLLLRCLLLLLSLLLRGSLLRSLLLQSGLVGCLNSTHENPKNPSKPPQRIRRCPESTQVRS